MNGLRSLLSVVFSILLAGVLLVIGIPLEIAARIFQKL